jgi:hypothetical protein
MKRLIFIVLLFGAHNLFAQENNFFQKSFSIHNSPYVSSQLSFDDSNLLINDSGNKKSVTLAVVYSLLLPGMGELYVGDYSTGRYLTAAEGALWLTYASFELYGTWVRDDARRFAATNAGVNLSGQSSQFFVDIGNYKNVYQYNERKLQERQVEKLYNPNSVYSWSWDTDGDRQKYRNLRISSDQAFNSTQFVIGAIIANHIVSAINAARLAISHNSQDENLQSLRFDTRILGSIGNPHGIALKISKTF